MTSTEKAVARYHGQYNCAQSVIMGFAEKYGIDENMALRLTAAYGAGLGVGVVCGAVSGGVAVIGMKYGLMPGDPGDRLEVYVKAEEFIRAFRAAKGTLNCEDLLGTDLPHFSQEAIEYRRVNRSDETVCLPAVMKAVEILESMGC